MSYINLPILQTKINKEEVNAVSAKKLHKELEIKRDFSTWIKNQIDRAELSEGVDFNLLTLKGEQVSGAKYSKEYILILDAAKHIAMMSQSKKAKEVRNYFIGIEKKYIAQLKKQANLSSVPKASVPVATVSQSSLVEQVFALSVQMVASGDIKRKLTSSEVRLVATLVKLIGGKKYISTTNAHIAEESLVTVKSVENSLTKLEEKEIINRVHVRNANHKIERRISINPSLVEEYPVLRAKVVAEPVPVLAVKSSPQQALIDFQAYQIDQTLARYAAAVERIKHFKAEGKGDFEKELQQIEINVSIEKFYQKHNQGNEPLNRAWFNSWLSSSKSVKATKHSAMFKTTAEKLDFMFSVYEEQINLDAIQA